MCHSYNSTSHTCTRAQRCTCEDSLPPLTAPCSSSGVCLCPTAYPPCHYDCGNMTITANGSAVCETKPVGTPCRPFGYELVPGFGLSSPCYSCRSNATCAFNCVVPTNPPSTPAPVQPPQQTAVSPSRRRPPSSTFNPSGDGVFLSSGVIFGVFSSVAAIVLFGVFFLLARRRQIALRALQQQQQQANAHDVAMRPRPVDSDLRVQPFHIAGEPYNPAVDSTVFVPQCVICFDNAANSAVNPCGHVLCLACVEKLDACPMCRGPLQSIIVLQPSRKPSTIEFSNLSKKQKKYAFPLHPHRLAFTYSLILTSY